MQRVNQEIGGLFWAELASDDSLGCAGPPEQRGDAILRKKRRQMVERHHCARSVVDERAQLALVAQSQDSPFFLLKDLLVGTAMGIDGSARLSLRSRVLQSGGATCATWDARFRIGDTPTRRHPCPRTA